MKTIVNILVLVFCWLSCHVLAVTGRHPTGVNVNTNGPTTVVITFQNLEANEQPVNAFWCGDVTATGVVIGNNPCVSGTLLGYLPDRYNLARIQGESGFVPGAGTDLPGGAPGTPGGMTRNMNDVMSIPEAVVRRAYQEAQRGASSEFYYIRQFVNNGINTFVTVTCRLAGGGARTPLSLTRVDLDFDQASFRKSITQVEQNTLLEKFSASIRYNGTGLLKGRWEVVMPGETPPTPFDLLSEGSLSIEDRPLQKRYRLVSRFQKFLPPNGTALIPGPDPRLLPTNEAGLYQILFRVEATNDKEGNTDTLGGIVSTGGSAGFSMPTLKYFVGHSPVVEVVSTERNITLITPQNEQSLGKEKIKFSWFPAEGVTTISMYRLELYEAIGEKRLIGTAMIKPQENNYQPGEKFKRKLTGTILWRVIGLNKQGVVVSNSPIRKLTIQE